MTKQTDNFDKQVKEKFQDFSPVPPDQIWEGIELELGRNAYFAFHLSNWKKIAAFTALLLLFSFSGWYFLSDNSGTDSVQSGINASVPPKTLQQDETFLSDQKNETQQSEPINSNEQESDSKTGISESKSTSDTPENSTFVSNPNSTRQGKQVISEPDNKAMVPDGQESFGLMSLIGSMDSKTIEFENLAEGDLLISFVETKKLKPLKIKNEKGFWETGLYFSPEVLFTDYDSVSMKTTYSVNVETAFYFNKHWFVRSGAGISFAGDIGYAKLDYISNELMGTYDDVYDITFDSVNGQVIPTYHTHTAEVWDSVRKLSVSQVTNKYMYLQFPLLAGYHKSTSKVDFYFYGGPAINVLISSQIDEPYKNYENITIIDLKNNLPARSPYYFQAWLGAGIVFKASGNLSFALEPNYRYNFGGVFENEPYLTGFSSFALRFGVIYKFD